MATSTSTSGIVTSSIDVTKMVSSLMAVESQPLVLNEKKITAVNASLSAYGQLSSALSSFKDTVDTLKTTSQLTAQLATSSNTEVFTASSDGSASVTNYDIQVSQLAKSQKLISKGFAETSATVGGGTLKFSFPGLKSESAYPDDGTLDSTYTGATLANYLNVELTLGASTTLVELRDAINSALNKNGDSPAISASIIDDGTSTSPYHLVITSINSGTDNAMEITAEDGLSDFSSIVMEGLGYSQEAQNAELTIDGFDIERASNTITDITDGLTINLLTTSTSSVKLSVTNDVDTIVSNVTKFVDAYNSLATTVASLTKFDTTGKGNNGPLFGDSTTRTIMNSLKSIMNGTITSNSDLLYLSSAGVQFESDGQLSVDSDTMTTAIDDYFDEFSALFADTDSSESGYVTGFADQLSTELYNILLSYDGTLAIKTDSLDDRLDTLNDTSEALNIKLTALQKRYQAQFSGLDQLLTNLTNQNTFLTAQLNALNNQNG